METNEKPSTTEAPRYRNVYGSGKFKWSIFPDYWKASWGVKPLLGVVYADDEFYAEREAYSKGLLPVNNTFKPMAVKIGYANPRPPKPYTPNPAYQTTKRGRNDY